MEEVEQICSRITIMDKGRSIASGSKDELKKMITITEHISIETCNLLDEHIKELSGLVHVYEVNYNDNLLTISFSGGKHNIVRVLNYLQEKNISFGRVYSELPTLNDVFLEITGTQLRDSL